jgi:glycosyltransferase involved in cell wall biosynthesis
MRQEKYHKIFEEKKCCVLIPTYNNAPVLREVIEDVLQYTDNIIIVNDGSTDETVTILEDFKTVHVYSYPENTGKGYAIKTGLKIAQDQGYIYAITMDSDGQHFAKDLPKFIEAAEKKKIIIGARNMEGKDQKQGSSFANKFSNFWFRVETGIKHPDTQSGYRLYPLKFVNKKKYFTNRYEFEIEVIVRNAWRGAAISSVPIDVHYPEEDKRITHFRPAKDFFRISVLNTVLVILAALYGLPARLYHSLRKKSLKKIIKDDILQAKDSNIKISKAVGFGFFMGIIPIWGWQTVTALALSHYFKLNKAIVILAANISIPPFLPFILFASFYTGALVLGNDLNLLHFTSDISFKSVTTDLLQYIIGSIVLAVTAGLITFGITYVLLKIFRKKKAVKVS